MTQDSRRFLPPDAVARVARLEIFARNVVEGFLSGMHRSPYFGQSIEFVQHREYVAGDDTRRIDWKAWSKTDKYYIKQFEEDTNLRCTLLVDLSESMQFGSKKINKAEYARQIVAVLSMLLLKQHDAVALATFDDAIRSRVPMSSKRTQLHDILNSLEAGTPQRKTSFGEILREVTGQETRRGLVVLVSDLLADKEGLFKGLQQLRHRNHDVMVFHVLDDQELDFEYAGPTKFEGYEDAGNLVCDPRSLRDEYVAAMNKYLEEVRRHCAKFMIDYQTVRTSEAVDAVLLHFMNHRFGLHHSRRN